MKRFTKKRKKPERMCSDLIKRQIDKEKQINRETDRIYKHIDTNINKTDMQIDIHMDRQIARQINIFSNDHFWDISRKL